MVIASPWHGQDKVPGGLCSWLTGVEVWKPSFFTSRQANLLDANLLDNRLRFCLNLHPDLAASCFLSWSSHFLMEFPRGELPNKSPALIPVSGVGFQDQIHISNHPECKSDDVHFLFLFGTSNLEKGEYFRILLPRTKIQSRWNWRNSTGHDFVRLSFDCWAIYARGWALHGWELEDLASPRGLKFICTPGLGRIWALWGLWARTGRSFAWHFAIPLFVVTGSALFHVCRCSFQMNVILALVLWKS